MFIPQQSRILVLAFTTLLASTVSSADPSERNPPMPIVPDPIVQAQLKELGKSQLDEDDKRRKRRFWDAIQALDVMAVKNRTELIRQLLWFHARANEISDGVVLPLVLHYTQLTEADMVHAIAPLLDTSDKSLRRSVFEVAKIVENASPDRGPNFGHYRNYIDASVHFSQEIEPALAGYMFERSAGDALRAFVLATIKDGEQYKLFLWAGHVVDDMLWKVQNGFIKQQLGRVKPEDIPADVPPQLELMAARPEWWARLWVAAIMAQHKELATPELITKLRRDENELVRKFIEQVQPTPPPP